jgi:hypothetical protein
MQKSNSYLFPSAMLELESAKHLEDQLQCLLNNPDILL